MNPQPNTIVLSKVCLRDLVEYKQSSGIAMLIALTFITNKFNVTFESPGATSLELSFPKYCLIGHQESIVVGMPVGQLRTDGVLEAQMRPNGL